MMSGMNIYAINKRMYLHRKLFKNRKLFKIDKTVRLIKIHILAVQKNCSTNKNTYFSCSKNCSTM